MSLKNNGKCNAAEIALRLIVEMGLSECPIGGGQPVGLLDLTRLMTDVLYMFHIGGWSDAILKGVMQPDIRITPSGDILSHKGFMEKIVNPLGQHFESTMLDRAVSSYKDLYEPIDASPSVRFVLPDAFLSAFKAEFGFSIDELRGIRESLEKLAVEKKKCVIVSKKDEILSHCAINNVVTPQSVENILKHFELWPRESWDTTPDGYSRKDWYPWRFGRQLSLIRRPIVRLENEDNPRYILSPGLFGVSVSHTVSRYYEADVEISECKSREMRQWIDREKNRAGHAFARKVFEAMQAQGYEARLENKVTSLLNEKLDHDYGDVDVLAWKAGGHVVLVIECKDLKFAKTPNELAEQLNSFSGQTSRGGKRDDLLKHLDRCNLLRKRSDRLAKTIGITDKDIQIRTVVCFSTPVPMQHVAELFPDVSFLTFDEITDKL